ncbi:MAG: ABC transporter substrate-binding protein/permease [Gemmatales bacterium]|nr:ABC transporter substrate-binding protein/permease [Gemmatales bacterium]
MLKRLTMDTGERLSPRARYGMLGFVVLTTPFLLTLGNPALGQSPTPSAPSDSGSGLPPLRWGADAEGGAPYIFYDPERPEQLIGFEVDLIRALERELGRRIEHQQYDFKKLVDGLERGDIDLAMNGLEITPDRQKRVRFSRPYYVFKLQLVTREGETEINSLRDCVEKQARVGTLENTAASRLLEQLRVPTFLYDSQVTPFEDLALGRLDAVLMDVPIVLYHGRNKPGLRLVEPLVSGRGYYAIAFRKDDEELARQFDVALERLLASGELRRIYETWGLWNASQEELYPPNQFGLELAREHTAPQSLEGWSFGSYFPLLLRAVWLTVELTVLSMAVAVVIGLIIAVCRLYGPYPLQLLALCYVEFFRGIPVLLLLYFLYFGLPAIGQVFGWDMALRWSPFVTAVLGLGLNYAAYEAEIYRAAISSIPRAQWEAAASLGLTPTQTFRYVILPQAIRIILPPSTTDFVALFKDTSLAGTITVVELSKQYQILSTSGADYRALVEIGVATALLYLLMAVPLGYLSRRLEERWHAGHLAEGRH